MENVFPATQPQVLALEYAKAKITADTTPEEFAAIYLDALKRITQYHEYTP